MADAKHLGHGFPPLVFEDSEILILGSFPSVLSRAQSFFYGHPRNRFWPLLSNIYQTTGLIDIDSKMAFCKLHHIALYDVIEECDIIGSSDASIKNAMPSDVFGICSSSKIKRILLNGKKASELFFKFHPDFIERCPDIDIVSLPSTSPANAAMSLERLYEKWAPCFF